MSVAGKEKAKVVLFCGLSYAGKTTILNIFTRGDVLKTAPTLGISLSTLPVDDMNFRIFDLGGQEKFREELTPLLPFADIIVFVVDSSKREQIHEVADELQRIMKNSSKKLTPICVLRHKSDLKKTISEKSLASKLGLKNVLDRPWTILSTSAVTLVGLKELYSWIIHQTTGVVPDFTIDTKKEDDYSFFYPCPMMKEMDDGSTFCLNEDGFLETELQSFGVLDEVSKMMLKALPDLRKECLKSTGKDICPDFCIQKNKDKVLRCPVTNDYIETRGIKVSRKRYEDAVILSQIYGQKIGEDICRECIYKILISPDTILSEEDIKSLRKSFL
ncbi:MAG: ADP-ribosylation factor-like protein [Candidatus Heimdallarchaeota archaeon]